MEKSYKFVHPRFDGILLVLDLLKEGAVAASEAARRKLVRPRSQRRGQSSRSGDDTPLWNILVKAIKAECNKRGDKAQLARSIGLPRQRLNDFLHRAGAQPDAERALMMLQWLASRRQESPQPGRKATPPKNAARGQS